jgi:hypothetical protein
METHDINVFDYNKKMIADRVEINPDDLHMLDISINEMIDAGVGLIKEITFEEDNGYNWVMLLTNDAEQVFYLELTEHGSIAVLNRDGSEGEPLLTDRCGFSEAGGI